MLASLRSEPEISVSERPAPLVSIVIPVYNAAPFLADAFGCVFRQSYRKIEVLVADDCSTDGSFEIVQRYKEACPFPIKVWRNQANLRQGGNWNTLYASVAGEFVLKLDADDLIPDDFIEKALGQFQRHPRLDIVFAAFKRTDVITGHTVEVPAHRVLPNGLVPEALEISFLYNPFHLCFALIRYDHCVAMGAKSPAGAFLPTEVCDFEFVLRSCLIGARIGFLPDVVGEYRIHETNSSHKPFCQLVSFYGDVLPLHKAALKARLGRKYRSRIVRDVIGVLKAWVRDRRVREAGVMLYMFRALV